MPASTAAHDALDRFVDRILADDAASDAAAIAQIQADAEAKIAKALADDAAADAVVLKAKDDEIAALKKRVAELETPKPPVEPNPPTDPNPPSTGVFAWKGLQTAFPAAATTGPCVANPVSRAGGIKATSNGQVFENLIITGGNPGIDANGKTGVIVRNCKLVGSGGTIGVLGMALLENCDISGYEDGFRPMGANWVVRGNYIHDLASGPNRHNDGGQIFDGPGLVEQNYIKARDTSAIMVQAWANTASGAPSGVVVRHNWLGGADLPLRIESECKGKGCKAIENVIQKGYYGHADLTGADEVRGNIDSVTGAPIS